MKIFRYMAYVMVFRRSSKEAPIGKIKVYMPCFMGVTQVICLLDLSTKHINIFAV